MSDDWQPVGDGLHEWQQVTGPKPDGTLTVSVRSVGQATRYPHVNFDYNPKTASFKYNHASFSGSKNNKCGMRENIQIAIAYLKKAGAL